jgi:hypothetical protein
MAMAPGRMEAFIATSSRVRRRAKTDSPAVSVIHSPDFIHSR